MPSDFLQSLRECFVLSGYDLAEAEQLKELICP